MPLQQNFLFLLMIFDLHGIRLYLWKKWSKGLRIISDAVRLSSCGVHMTMEKSSEIYI